MKEITLPTLHVTGDAQALGRAQGEHFREGIRAFVANRFDAVSGYMSDRGTPDGLERLAQVAARGLELQREWDPDGYAEHVGIAEAAGIEPLRLFTATNMTDNRDAVLLAAAAGDPLSPKKDEGCSAVLVPASGSKTGVALAGQTWDLNPPDVAYVVAIHRTPSEGPQTWTVTCNGCLTLMGLNEHGVACGTTNIKTYGSKPGVGYLSILHRVVRCEDAAEAREVVRTAPHAGAHTYWIADATTQVEWEASPNAQVERTTAEGPVFRTNHCLSDVHCGLEGEVVSESSKKRFARLQAGLAEPVDRDDLIALFSDRSDGDESINRYEEDGLGTATNAVFIAEPAKKRAFACRGPADRGTWIELSF